MTHPADNLPGADGSSDMRPSSSLRTSLVYAGFGLVVGLAAVALRFGPDLPAFVKSLEGLLNRQPVQQTVVVEPPKPALPSHDPLAGLPADTLADLTAPAPLNPVPFSRVIGIDPEPLCKQLSSMGLKGAKWQANPLAPKEWICDSDVISFGPNAPAPADGTDTEAPPEPSSVFVSMRGHSRHEVDLIRLKLNLTEPQGAPAARKMFGQTLQAIHDKFHWDVPPEVLQAVERIRSAHVEAHGVIYEVRRGFSDMPRLDVVISTRDGAGIVANTDFAGSLNILPDNPRSGKAHLPILDLRAPQEMPASVIPLEDRPMPDLPAPNPQ